MNAQLDHRRFDLLIREVGHPRGSSIDDGRFAMFGNPVLPATPLADGDLVECEQGSLSEVPGRLVTVELLT